ncbi:MAG: FKBP-type peptidyl-prolyl cis-trans isomerase [Bacteroidetes bacterium]|nr:FKBP-type peptidyl-prolyl cis-trans isomerase [Bacteroidota bacterium]
MQVSEHKVVSVSYNLTASSENGPEELVEQTSTDRPFTFLFGFGGVLPDFEENLTSKQKGDKFDFKIEASKAYGVFEEEYIVKVDKSAFMVDGKFDEARVKVGEDIEMNDAEGNQLVGRVMEITDSSVEMDFNHPLAGFDLHFIGEVLDVRPASQEELEHGHVHGPGGHHH